MDTIVVGVDDSPGARTALTWAAGQARTTGSRLRVVHVYDLQIGWIDEYNEHIPQWREKARAEAQRIVERVVGDTLATSRPEAMDVRVLEGSPADVLHDESRDAALLVVGTRGRGGFAGLLLGSVSQRVAQHSGCPVVIVPMPEDEAHDG
jgi:nucleotide-binding universal stress UspA family protein